MKKDYRAFLSCSFAPEDAEINSFFQNMIRAFDIQPEIYDYQEIGRLSDKVKERIRNSDCLIAIATRRTKHEGTEEWACSDWIHDELALANAYRIPIAIFVEKGVRIEGLIALEERRQEFSREKLLQNAPSIARFLFGVHSHLESLPETLPLMLRHFFHVHEEVQSRERTARRGEVLMECLAETLEATHHLLELDDSTPGLSLQPIQFDFKCIDSPPNVRVEPIVVKSSDSQFLWKITFSPALSKGQYVKYAFKVVSNKYSAMDL
jgi:hypothetical protein